MNERISILSDEKEILERDKRDLKQSVLSERERVLELEENISSKDITIEGYENSLKEANDEKSRLQGELNNLLESISYSQEESVADTVAETASTPLASQPVLSNTSSGFTMTVEATAYSTNEAGLSDYTATGINLRENPYVVAVDPSVIPLGSTIYVEGYGTFVAGDTGGAIIGNRIDIHFTDLNACYNFGRRNVQIQVTFPQ